MSIIGALIDDKAASLQATYPRRLVTRILKDFSDYDTDELEAGVITLIANKITGKQWQEIVHFILAVDVSVKEGTESSLLEEAELTIAEELKTWAMQNHVDINEMHMSRQLGSPNGWVRCNMQMGPIDLTSVDISGLSPFNEIHIETSLGGNADDPVMIADAVRA